MLLIDLQRKQRRVGAQETSSEFLWELAAAARGLLQAGAVPTTNNTMMLVMLSHTVAL